MISEQVDLVCSEVAHVFDDHSEICKCGEQPRHRAVKCDHCGNTYWTKRATNPKVETESSNESY